MSATSIAATHEDSSPVDVDPGSRANEHDIVSRPSLGITQAEKIVQEKNTLPIWVIYADRWAG
jgi:hypothetical protein